MDLNPTKDTDDNRTTNYEGGLAFEGSPAMRLYKVVINNLIEDTFYREDEDALEDVRDAFDDFVATCDEGERQFPLKLAAYARSEMYLRDVPQVLLVLSARSPVTKPYVRQWTPHIIKRADEPMTVIALWTTLYGDGTLGEDAFEDITVSVPKPLQKGINDALENFNAYQFAKYDSDRRVVGLKDVFNLTRPKASSEERQRIHDRLMWGELDSHPEVEPLPTPTTWETVLSEHGNTPEAWREALPYMGLFARIRNIRNMREAGIAGYEILDTPLKGASFMDEPEFTINDAGLTMDTVRKRKLYPFRFYQAYVAMRDAPGAVYDEQLAEWLSDAMAVGAENLPDLSDSFVAVDTSGSMSSEVSGHSSLSCDEIAAVFGASLSMKNADVGVFANDFERVAFHHDTPLVERVQKLLSTPVGGSTYGYKVLADINAAGDEYERVIYLTDMQMYDEHAGRLFASAGEAKRSVREEWEKYDTAHPGAPWLFLVDLQSYGHLSTPEGSERVVNVNGWTERIFDFIQYAESSDAALDDVRAYAPEESP